MSDALLIGVEFPRRAYSGGELGAPEPLPSPARLHAAFAAAAAAGPWASPKRDDVAKREVLTALPEHAEALRWLERTEPRGIVAPAFCVNPRSVRRYRLRAARAPYLESTPFEPFSALDGPLTYAWPPPVDGAIVRALEQLACEITHVGAAESTAIVRVRTGSLDRSAPGFMALSGGRGPGLALRVATAGRFDALMHAYREAARLATGRHSAGNKGRQATDEQPPGIGELHTRLLHFGRHGQVAWPYSEAWILRPHAGFAPWMLRVDARVGFAAAVHRALVATIADDVPPTVSGRDGDGPLRGPGHLAIHLTVRGPQREPAVVLGIPAGSPDADRATLLEALADGLSISFARRRVALCAPEQASPVPFWSDASGVLATEVPMVLDVPGTPRHAPWTLDDAVICSVGYAMRGVLEAQGVRWGGGWGFRRALVAHLRELGVCARARRVAGSAARYCHRARGGDLLVAADAIVSLGELDAEGGLLAIGRARHLGGGLLRPLTEAW